jgi:NADH-quinone oxidoreductase subunit J
MIILSSITNIYEIYTTIAEFSLAILLFTTINIFKQNNPIFALFFFILNIFSTMVLLLVIGLDLISILFLMIYIGAIAILFLFVIMMLHLNIKIYNKITPESFIILFIFSAILYILLFNNYNFSNLNLFYNYINTFKNVIINYNYTYNIITTTGLILYTNYLALFILNGLILFSTLVGAVLLTKTQLNQNKI